MRTLLIAIPMLLAATGAFAQDLATLNKLAACRAEPDKVKLTFSYSGGACQETDEATVAFTEGAVATVSVPTHNTAEVCTMQAVDIAFDGVLTIPAAATGLDVQVLNPDGEVQAGGKTDIAAECGK